MSSDIVRAPIKVHGEPDLNSRILVTELQILCKGDHVVWRRLRGVYWHHCIVSDVKPKKGKLEVIGFQVLSLGKIRVLKRWKSFDLRKRNLYRIEYDLGICYPPEVVLVRALSQVGNSGYSFLDDNCEHFARWCKTGDRISTQIDSLKQRLNLEPSHPNPHRDCRCLSSTIFHTASQPRPNYAALAPPVGNQACNLSLIQTYYTKFDTSSNAATGYLHR